MMIYHEPTQSLCSTCHRKIPAKIMRSEKGVFLKKYCPEHKQHLEMLEEDVDYYLRRRDFDKCGTPSKTQTPIKYGCPFDCGICPNHDQHTCIGLLEITNACNMKCPMCYAKSGEGDFLSMEKIEEMLDFAIDAENGTLEILQISGGEPTIHPQIFEILKRVKSKNIKYVMLNTNGIKIAEDESFVQKLSEFNDAFEIYLQFDGFSSKTHQFFRGKDVSEIRTKAITNLQKYNIPVTLVVTVQKGVNEDELCDIVRFAISEKGIRGVNFQPMAYFGRLPKDSPKQRSTLSGIVKNLETNLSFLQKGDILPLPCNVERNAVTYLVDKKPITRGLSPKDVVPHVKNTFAFHLDDALPKNACCLFGLSKFFPKGFCTWSKAKKRSFIDEKVFRISVTSFLDFYNFDLKSMQKECIHILTQDKRRIPFSAYNMFYRNPKQT